MKVLIAGGGIAGPACALFLQRAGIANTVFEARTDRENVGGGLSLAPNGMNVLDALGLAEAAQVRGTVARENWFRSERGRVLAHYDNGSRGYGRPAVNLRRADLHGLLVSALRDMGGEVVTGKRVTHVAATSTKVTMTCSDGHTATGDLVVGADGLHSVVRTATWPHGPAPHYVGIVGVGGFTPLAGLPMLPEQSRTALNFTFGREGMFGYGGARPDEVMWWCNAWRQEPLTAQEIADLKARRIASELARTFDEYHQPIPALLAASEDSVALNVYDMPMLPDWHHGRVILIGDAAHAVSPNSGQGAALALEDAQSLATLLVAADGDHSRAFPEFERRRRARAERVMREGRRRAQDKKRRSAIGSAVRNAMLAAMLRLFGERSHDWLYRYRVEP
jgi:2-polyprenyl-6-methoxyphenol hydroxylase-like FAD-dependent oxidoreductase